jgi:hypothetical protein
VIELGLYWSAIELMSVEERSETTRIRPLIVSNRRPRDTMSA